MIKLFLMISFLFLTGCSEKAQPVEDKKIHNSTEKHETGHIETH